MTNLITLDGMSEFPKEFLDLKSFHSNKAQALVDSDQSQDFDKTGQSNKEATENENGAAAD